MALSGETIDNFLVTNFELKIQGWSLSEIEEMMPWERTIYMAQHKAHLEEKKRSRENNNN